MQFKQFKPLLSSMRRSNNFKERFTIEYNHVGFDVILDIDIVPFELLIGAIDKNWACVLQMNNYNLQMSDDDFFQLCKILNLHPGKGSFTSFDFLKYIADHAPTESRHTKVEPHHLAKYRITRIAQDQEPEKIYFHGWNDHTKDGKRARNFEKTELLLGKQAADYCRKHGISSMWSAVPHERINYHEPWS